MIFDGMESPPYSKLYWIPLLVCTSLLSLVNLGVADEVVTKPEAHCNCDLKSIVQSLQKIAPRKKALFMQRDALGKQITSINQKLLNEVMAVSAKQSPEAQAVAKITWSVLSASIDATFDYIDFKLSESKQQLKKGVDLLGPMVRGGKKVLGKTAGKGAKIYKALGTSQSHIKKDPRLRKIAHIYEKIDAVSKKIDQVNADEIKAWLKLLGADCQKTMKDRFPGNGTIKAHDLEASLNSVSAPVYMPPTDRDIEDEFFEQGFLKSDIKKIRNVYGNIAKMEQNASRYRSVAYQINEYSKESSQDCQVCGMLEQLRAISDFEKRLRYVREDWLQTHVKLLRNAIGSYHDITNMFATEASSKILNTANPVYQKAALAASLLSMTSGIGTSMSVIDASFKVFQTLHNYYYKVPVSEEIKKNTRFMLLFTDGLKEPIKTLTSVLQQAERNKAELIRALINNKDSETCPAEVVKISVIRSGDILFLRKKGEWKPSISRPIDRGSLTLEVEFNSDMDIEQPADVTIQGYGAVSGRWADPRKWSGSMSAPSGKKLAKLTGMRSVYIQAKARSWSSIKVDPQLDGSQLQQDAKLYFKGASPKILSVSVRSGGKLFYRAPKYIADYPITPGNYKLTIFFDRDMSFVLRPEVQIEPPASKKKDGFSLSDFSRFGKQTNRVSPIPVFGQSSNTQIENNRVWVGKFSIPSGLKTTDHRRWPVSVMAESAAGIMMDSDAEKTGNQPDRTYSLMIKKERNSDNESVSLRSACWTGGIPSTKLILFSDLHNAHVRGLLTWPRVDTPITLEGYEEDGHLSLEGSSKGFSEYSIIQSLRLDLQRHVATRGGNTASPYHVTEWSGDVVTKNLDGTEKNKIRFLPLYSPVTSISVVDAKFSQRLDSVAPGSSIWLKATGKNVCSGVRDKMVLVMRVPSVSTPQNITVQLTETDTDSGIFRSDGKGIVINGNPGAGHARISIEPEGGASMSLGLFDPNSGNKLYKIAGNVSAAVQFMRKSSPAAVKKTNKHNPLMPNVSYSAVQSVNGTRSIIYYTPGKMRTAFLGSSNNVSISREDKKLIWQLWIKEKKYVEMNMPPRMYQFSEISRKKMGHERINGINTTKYRIRSKDANGTDSEGIFWISDDSITVKSQTSMTINGKARHMVMELSDIKVGPQKPSIFEIPKSFTVRAMNGMGG